MLSVFGERFVHMFAGGQDHPDQRVHTSGVGQGQSGENGCSGSLTLPSPPAFPEPDREADTMFESQGFVTRQM
jgi:hypothetical protein